MEKLLCPSMMCAKYENLAEEIKELEEANIDIFHIDIMDGDFVPNFGMGLQDTELICKLSSKKVDVHLMINNPSRYIKKFADLGVDIIYIHPESQYIVFHGFYTICMRQETKHFLFHVLKNSIVLLKHLQWINPWSMRGTKWYKNFSDRKKLSLYCNKMITNQKTELIQAESCY